MSIRRKDFVGGRVHTRRDTGEAGPVALSADALVALSSVGVVLVGREGRRLTITGPQLALLESLARAPDELERHVSRAAEASPAPADGLHWLAAQLRQHELLDDDGPEPVRAPLDLAGGAPRPPDDQPLAIRSTWVFRPGPEGFVHLDHDGVVRLVLDARGMAAASAFASPCSRREAYGRHRGTAGPAALSEVEFDELVGRLLAVGLLGVRSGDEADELGPQARFAREAAKAARLLQVINADVDDQRRAETERRATTGRHRTAVVPVQHNGTLVPLALGMLVAYARVHDGGRLDEHYQFLRQWMIDEARVRELLADGPAIFLFSNYDWSHRQNLEISKLVKSLSPASVTIHGGPDTPKYRDDVVRYFRANPHVDVTVRGEGEVTCAEALAALAGRVGVDHEQPADLSALHAVDGLAYRSGDDVVSTADRDRIADLDIVPSPYLTGLFDVYQGGVAMAAVIETNRGCPYGCTYCDWGSSTLSRIRKFDLDRVFAELEWCAERSNDVLMVADANFGILERDVAIAERVAELKRTQGSPRAFVTNYAKNTVKHLRRIVATMVDAGILAEGLLSLQTLDSDTLDTVRRSNIKTEKYDELAVEFRRAGLPLYVDLMLGLPGSTVASFSDDLQQCIDREVTAKVFATQMLVNSPMNEPAYRTENAIEVEAGTDVVKVTGDGPRSALVVSSASFTRTDYEYMRRLRLSFLLFENFGVLRHVMRFVRQETGVREVELIADLHRLALDEPDAWPTLAYTVGSLPTLMAPPVSWRLFVDEAHRYLVERRGVADDSALRTVLEVQHALLPAADRTFPVYLELSHDIGAWHDAMMRAKVDGHVHDWPERIPRLGELPPAVIEIDDPERVCQVGLGFSLEHADQYENWELRSPVSRPVVSHRMVV